MEKQSGWARAREWLLTGPKQPAMPMTVANPPNVSPTSPLTQPISVVSAVDFYRSHYVSRDVLMSIPAFRRAISLIAGVTGSLPYYAYRDDVRLDKPFLNQPENGLGYTRSVTWTRVAEDLLLDGASLLMIREKYEDGYPKSAERIDFNLWSQDEQTGDIIISGEKQDPGSVRLFTAPFNGLCHDAGPTLVLMARLRDRTAKYMENPQAREYFQETDGLDMDDAQIESFLSDWMEKRRAGVTAYIPSGVALNTVDQMTPDQLAMADANEYAIAEVARLTGVDATWLSINVSTRTYSNIIDERRNFLDFVCAPYVQAIEQRLSLGDTTPQGTYVKASLDVFLRTSTLDRYQSYSIALNPASGFLTQDEVRSLENRPPLGNQPTPTSNEMAPPTGETDAQ